MKPVDPFAPSPLANVTPASPESHAGAYTKMFGPGEHPGGPSSAPPAFANPPAGGSFGSATQAFSVRSPSPAPQVPSVPSGPSEYTRMMQAAQPPILAQPPAPAPPQAAAPAAQKNPMMLLLVVFGILLLAIIVVILIFALRKH